jgi:hypothetical protein
MADDTSGNYAEKIRLSILLDDDNDICRKTISTITVTNGAMSLDVEPTKNMEYVLTAFPRIANTTSWCRAHQLTHQEWDSTKGFQGEGPTCQW